MANNLGVYNQQLDGSTFLNAGVAGGQVNCLLEEVELAALAANTVINLSKPLGGKMQVVDAVIYHDALGTGVTLKLGDTADDDGIIPATAAASAGKLEIAIGQMFAELDGDNLVLTTGGATATGTVKVIVHYVNI